MTQDVLNAQAAHGIDIEAQREQIGRVVVQRDTATPAPMRGMAVTFNRKDPAPGIGEAVPPGWHVAYFLPATPAGELNADGTPKDNGVLPSMPLPRRMHAGLKLKFVSPVLVGDELRRENRFSGIEAREGRNGALVVSTQTRSIFTPRGLAIEEEFTQVHLAAAKREVPTPKKGEPPPADATWERTVTPDAINLFRYSALTFNPHRIHYDLAYAAGVEGFPGLVVHGMFTAQCLIDLARDRLPQARFGAFTFRAGVPLFVGQPIRLLGRHSPGERRVDLWAVSPAGTVATRATMSHD